MSRLLSGSFALSLLPIIAVLGVLSLGAPRRNVVPEAVGTLVFYLSPSSATDSVHIIQLNALLKTIQSYNRRAAAEGRATPSHSQLSAEYRLIVHETTQADILRAGLPLDVR